MPVRQISFTRLLTYGFGIIVMLGLSAVLYLGVEGAERNTQQLLSEMVESTMATVSSEIEEHMDPVESQMWYLQKYLGDSAFDLDDHAALNLLLNGALASTPQVLGLDFFHVGNGLTHVSRTGQDFDTKQVHHTAKIKQYLKTPPKGLVRLPPAWNGRLGHTIIPVIIPIFQQEDFKGVLAAVISLEAISRFFKNLSDQVGFQVFALSGEDRVLAHPDLVNQSRVSMSADNPMPQLADMRSRAMVEFWNPKRKPVKWLELKGIEGHRLRVEGTDYIYFYQQIPSPQKQPLTVGIYIEQEEMPEWVKRLFITAAMGIVLILILLIVVAWVSRRIGASVQRIVIGFDAISHQELDNIPPLPGSRVAEFDKVAEAYNRMLTEMKQHQTVQKLFGQYVPEKIAQKLVQQEGSLEPQQATATILFCDLEAFTALSEKLQPPQIVTLLNSFFSDVVEMIEAEGGVITQFQGDAVLAIFNVPSAQVDHADRAYRAALNIQQLVSSKIYDGQRLQCRIGINTGDVIAGSVGAKDRLNYTVHGDAVNLAARLEALNKNYSTRILLSDSTVELLTDAEHQEKMVSIGEVQVRGRNRSVALYTPQTISHLKEKAE